MSKSTWDPHTYKVLILEAHLDSYGHVNNAMYLTLLEEARWDFITAGGYGYEVVHKTKKGPVILDIHLSFLKELRLREEITIESQVVEYSSKVGSMRQRMLRHDGTECAVVTMKFGFFDLEVRRLIAPPPEWLKALGHSKN